MSQANFQAEETDGAVLTEIRLEINDDFTCELVKKYMRYEGNDSALDFLNETAMFKVSMQS